MNRNETWHNDAGAFVKYLARCQAMLHRREGDVDWFFVAGEGKDMVMFNASLNGRVAEVWDPVAVTRKTATGKPLDDPRPCRRFLV